MKSKYKIGGYATLTGDVDLKEIFIGERVKYVGKLQRVFITDTSGSSGEKEYLCEFLVGEGREWVRGCKTTVLFK